jgi:hypothetical protein
MKVVLDEKDLSLIERINEDINNGENIPLFINRNDDFVYTFEFRCTDIARANLFANLLMNNNLNKEAKEFQETFGIDVICLNYSKGDSKIRELKSHLKNLLDELERM